MRKKNNLIEKSINKIIKQVINEEIEGKLKVSLEINCPQRVITSTNLYLNGQGNSKIIDAFCTPSFRKNTP
jgi:hypothetical protein